MVPANSVLVRSARLRRVAAACDSSSAGIPSRTSSGAAAQTTVGVGQTLAIGAETFFSSHMLPQGALVMDGGTLSLADLVTGTPLSIYTNDAALLRGAIVNAYSQGGPARLVLQGTTTLPGGAGGTYPADGMYLRGNSETGLLAYNNGELVQTGNGQLTTQGLVEFRNQVIFDIRNDLGFVHEPLGNTGALRPFFNTGVFKKTMGTGTSVVNARFHQDGGSVEAESGSISLTAGGVHTNASFAASPGGVNPSGQILFGGAHAFAGTVTTQSGGLTGLAAGGSLDVQGTWNQLGLFSNAGSIVMGPSGTFVNSGLFLPAGGGVSGALGGTLLNTASGFFSGDIAPQLPAGNGGAIGLLDVTNRGTFTVAAGQSIQVRNFVNESGTVTIEGTAENDGGTFQLLGGILSGNNGFINGDTFVGGGPGAATFTPGASPGTMTINGAFSLLPGGVLELEVERDALTGAIVHDQVFAQSFLLDGHISFLVGAGVTESDVLGLQFLDCGGNCSMVFDSNFSYDFPGRPGSAAELTANGIFISALAPVPEPHGVAMLLAGIGLIGAAIRRRRQPG